MTVTITFFESVPEFKENIEQAIMETKTVLGETLSKTEEVRGRYELSKKRFESIKKLSSGKTNDMRNARRMEVAGFKVLVNPSADYELNLMEESVSSLQQRLEAFEKTKEIFPSLNGNNMKIAMVLNDGIPAGFMFYVPDL